MLVAVTLAACISCKGSSSPDKPVVYTVTFDTDGGSEIPSQKVNKNEKAKSPEPVPVKEKCIFAGWYKDDACSIEFDFGNAITGNITLYAKWNPIEGNIEVKFETSGGTSIVSLIIAEGQKLTKPQPDPSKANYKFGGWFADQDFSLAFNFETELTQSTTIYAKWIPLYTITFSGADVPSQTVEKGQKATKPADPVNSSGALFGGWYTSDKYTTVFDFDSEIHENKTIYAKWRDSWTVTFSGSGGTPSQFVKNGQKASKPDDPADTSSQTFDGWYADANYTAKFDFNTVITKDTTVYAKWLSFFTITFDSVDGSAVAPVKAVQGKLAVKPADPTRDSRSFDGWYLDSAYQQPFDFETTVITRDIKLYAKWAMPQGVTDAITIKIEKAQLDVTYTIERSGNNLQYDSCFVCNDGPADWYVNNELVQSNSTTYTTSRTAFVHTGICTVEARKIINGIEYSWSKDVSL